MKKKMIIPLAAFILVVGIAAATVLVGAKDGPTGAAGVEVQREFLYHDGTLFIYEGGYTKSLPSYATEVGTIKRIDNQTIPQEEMVASRLEVGLTVFSVNASGAKNLVVKVNDSRYETFVPFEGDPADWQP